MKKKLLALLIALASTMMPNLVSAIALEIHGDLYPIDQSYEDWSGGEPLAIIGT